MNNIKERAAGNGCLRVLGVDPAAAGPTGYGIVESDGQCCRVLHYGALKSVSKQQRGWSGAALQCVHALICGLIEEFAPDAMAVESVFTALNMRTALRLAEVRGVVLLAAGHADKRQVQTMVRALLSMTVTPEPEDAADALAVALCHLRAEQVRRRFGLPRKNEGTKLRSVSAAAASASATTGIRTSGTTRGGLPRIVSTR